MAVYQAMICCIVKTYLQFQIGTFFPNQVSLESCTNRDQALFVMLANAIDIEFCLRITKVFAIAGQGIGAIGNKSLFGYSYRRDGILSPTKCTFNNKIKISIGTSPVDGGGTQNILPIANSDSLCLMLFQLYSQNSFDKYKD